MKKLLLFALSVGALAAQTVSIPVSDASSSSVGRNRTVEEIARLPGLHNPVHIVQRRAKADCVEAQKLIASHDTNSERYQLLLADDACAFTVSDQWTHNLVTNAGLNWLADIMGNTSTPSVNTQCNYIGLTNSAITPGATDTTLTGEIAVNGLSRAQATYTHSANATTFTLGKTFTASGAQSAQAGAVFTAVSTGTMCYEDTFTAASLQTNDTLTVTWTITI